MDIFVSAHGGRWASQQPNLAPTGQSSIVFYVGDRGLLSNADGYRIFANLAAGRTPGGTVVETVSAGKRTYDYACWYAPEFRDHCGIFEVGTGKLLRDLSNNGPNNPLQLSAILQAYPNCNVYWVCCREVTQDDEGEPRSNVSWMSSR